MDPYQSAGFAGKVALVTGASSGIGLATAAALAAAGAQVVATGRDEARLRRLAGDFSPGVDPQVADISRPDEIEGLMRSIAERHGRLDILVVNAGVSNAPEVGDLDLSAYDRLMDVNVKGAVFTFVKALPLLAESAAVVFVGSAAARKGHLGDALYAGSKGFIRSFARNAGTDPELMARRIRVNVVSPGPIETPLTEEAVSQPEIRTHVEQMIPLRRWGHAEEVADAILFLASPAAAFTTGADLTVDGGLSHM